MIELLLILVLLAVLACRLSLGHPGLEDLRGWAYAHRGLHRAGVPENSMAAFRAALDAGYGIELDLHLLKDGNIAVMHDSLLNRTTGCGGRIEDLTTGELKEYKLEGTEETIPEFMDVLTLFHGKAPLIVELKPVDNNHAALCEAVCKMMETYEGPYCLESFDPRCLVWLKKHRPEILRGQLTENFFKTRNELPGYMRFLLTHNLTHFVTQPDFVAYRFDHRKTTVMNDICRGLWGGQGVAWTLRTREDYDTAVKEGWIPIFENFCPEGRFLQEDNT